MSGNIQEDSALMEAVLRREFGATVSYQFHLPGFQILTSFLSRLIKLNSCGKMLIRRSQDRSLPIAYRYFGTTVFPDRLPNMLEPRCLKESKMS